jgi:hypothetical protein
VYVLNKFTAAPNLLRASATAADSKLSAPLTAALSKSSCSGDGRYLPVLACSESAGSKKSKQTSLSKDSRLNSLKAHCELNT